MLVPVLIEVVEHTILCPPSRTFAVPGPVRAEIRGGGLLTAPVLDLR